MAPVASLVSVHHLRAGTGLKMTGWGIMFICGTVLRCAGTWNPG